MDVKFRFEIFDAVLTPDRQNGLVIANVVDQCSSNFCIVRLENGIEQPWNENILLQRVF